MPSHNRFAAFLVALFFMASPALADEDARMDRQWVNEELEKIDKYAASCGASVECGQETAKRYSEMGDLMTKKISALCAGAAGEKARPCQEDLARLLESNTAARVQSGKLQRFLYPGLSEEAIAARILASDIALIGAYIDALAAMLPE